MKVILASQSPRRKALLRLLLEDFLVLPADIDETVRSQEVPEKYVLRMAQEKAAAISKSHPLELVIASDTIVVYEGEILGKPRSREQAREMLMKMNGQMHTAYTAVVMQVNQRRIEKLTSAKVTFFELTTQEIDDYLDQEEYADKAGGYGIQGSAAVFVKDIQGDYYSIVGFPVGVVKQMLKQFAI